MALGKLDVRASINVDHEGIRANVAENLDTGLPLIPPDPQPPHDGTLVIVAGGPSVNEFLKDIRRKSKSKKFTVWATNGSLHHLMSKGIVAEAVVMMDGRDDMLHFVQKVWKKVRYYMATQMMPEVIATLRDKSADVMLWNSYETPTVELLKERGRRWGCIGGGCTIGLRAMALGYHFGYRKFHLYGFDSCYAMGEDAAHHAYTQDFNDDDIKDARHVVMGGRDFYVSMWMVAQLNNFVDVIPKYWEQGCDVQIFGEGYLPYANWLLLEKEKWPDQFKGLPAT